VIKNILNPFPKNDEVLGGGRRRNKTEFEKNHNNVGSRKYVSVKTNGLNLICFVNKHEKA
jgi:hypothetical protein